MPNFDQSWNAMISKKLEDLQLERALPWTSSYEYLMEKNESATFLVPFLGCLQQRGLGL